MHSLRDDKCRRRSWAPKAFLSLFLGIFAALSTGIALADKAKPKSVQPTPSSQSLGIMTFDNVRVVNAPELVDSKTTQSKTKGAKGVSMRAYSSADTGELMEATPAKAQELDSAAAPSTPTDEQAPQVSPSGGNVYAVGENLAVYQVAHKSGGRVVIQETTGKSAAEKAAAKDSAHQATDASEEVSNER